MFKKKNTWFPNEVKLKEFPWQSAIMLFKILPFAFDISKDPRLPEREYFAPPF